MGRASTIFLGATGRSATRPGATGRSGWGGGMAVGRSGISSPIEVDPLPIEVGRLTRARLARGWTVDLGTSAVAARELTAPGQRWMRHAAAERSATGFPQADCIRVTLRAGAEWTLVWPSPRAALWVGASLMVNTTSGEVVFFEGLADVPELVQ